ncbi:MAG: bacillithiol biosynthesis cysteine-adding enzyme BshC [Acidobacteria bacterium]|nr:bacillithiol biosynthesis cysteine-adding enzyme BshC [Acidobacteriota bacterium]MCA1639114.1 bacillithiol biosynthesis cysteine-adding enzyme BshC [Acidobacteriota bacterium]
MISENADRCQADKGLFQIETLPFSDIPNQSKLFIKYQQNPAELAQYYGLSVDSHTQISKLIPGVLENYKTDRNVLCDTLEKMNRSCGASEKTLENIKLLRQSDCVAVVSGQQAGLFTGPLYTIYKALSAVKLTECLRGRGIKAVPVFWIATEDHDFAEVSKAYVLGQKGELVQLKNEPQRCYENLPVGYVALDDSIKKTIEELFAQLPQTEFTDELRALIEKSWKVGVDYGDAFAKLLTEILGKYGLIMLCPLNENLKKLAAPLYVEAVKKSKEIVEALQTRGKELEKNGFHAQVFVAGDYFPLFWQAKNRTRHALKQTKNGKYKVKDIEREFTLDELAELAAQQPQRFSPSVVLRSVVQDYLLPTVTYFGGAAEIAYFAQSAEVYRILNRPQTLILHRASFTLVEPKHAKTLDKYDLKLKELLAGIENILPQIVEKYLNREMADIFIEVEEKINTQLNRLDRNLAQFDPTLAKNLANRRRKILYHIGNLRTKFQHAQIQKDAVVRRRIETAFASLLPQKNLQERSLNIITFLNLYGLNLIDWIYDAIDLDDKGHRLIYL